MPLMVLPTSLQVVPGVRYSHTANAHSCITNDIAFTKQMYLRFVINNYFRILAFTKLPHECSARYRRPLICHTQLQDYYYATQELLEVVCQLAHKCKNASADLISY